uniref:Putative rhoa gtpase effector dia/diaphanous n=1 Tax=Ixodes ricinus TaxID=34613 RepID=A0A0K8RJP9_IXORI
MDTHLIGKVSKRLSEEDGIELLNSMEVRPKENIQEYIGATKIPIHDKYIYRFVLDFDCKPGQALKWDHLLTRAGKFAKHLVSRYRPYMQHQSDNIEFLVPIIITSRSKYFENEKVFVDRWHLHFTNIVFLSDKMRNGSRILTPVRELAMKDIKEDWPDLDLSAGSQQWLVYGSRKFGAATAYKYESSVTFCVNVSNDTVYEKFSGPNMVSSKSLRILLSMHRQVDDNDIVIDWTRVPTNNLLSILQQENVNIPVASTSHVVDCEEIEDLEMNVDLEQEEDTTGYELQSSSTEWGEIFVKPSKDRVRIKFPEGRPTFNGRHLMNPTANSPETCIQLAKAYRGISHFSDGETKALANAREYIFKWGLLKLVYFANYACQYSKWYRLLLIIASNMNYSTGRRIFRVLSQQVHEHMKDDPGYHYDRAVAWLWKYTSPDCLDSDNSDDEGVEYDSDFYLTNSERLIPTVPRCTKSKKSRFRKRKSCKSKRDDNKPLNVPRRILRLQYEPIFQMTPEEQETSKWLLNELTDDIGVAYLVHNNYIKRLVNTDKMCMLIHNKATDSYELFKYNSTSGTMVLDNMSQLILDLEFIAIKTCFQFESAVDNMTPFNLCFEFLIKSTKKLEYKLDFTHLNTYLHSSASNQSVNLTSNRHLILPNKLTYDLYDAKYIPWDSSQLCTVRSECDIELGKDELVEHVYTEVHPTRGGLEYRCKLVCRWIDAAYILFEGQNLGEEMVYVVKAITTKVVDKMYDYMHDLDSFMEKFLSDLYTDPKDTFKEYEDLDDYEDSGINVLNGIPTASDIHKINADTITCIESIVDNESNYKFSLYSRTVAYIISLRIMLARYPKMYKDVMRTACLPSDEDDDGGPVIFVRNRISWDSFVWTMLVEIFGSMEQARLVLEFLALGLSTDSNGRLVMFMHGQVANGKSLFIGMLHKLFGNESKMVRTLPSNFFTSRSDNRMDATFRSNAEEIRFAIENEIAILDMDEGGRRKFKQFTGGDRVSNRQPYDKCNNDFRISAKFITASNDIPYISSSMIAEQSRLMIIPTVSTFVADKAELRKQLLQNMAADRYSKRLFSYQFPTYEWMYTQGVNKMANVMTEQTLSSLDARSTLFPEYYNNIFDPSFDSDIMNTPRGMPTQRWLLGNATLMHDSTQLKMGAALCRILLNHVVPSMGGLQHTSLTIQRMENYVRNNVNLFGSYKNVLFAILKRLIVYRKGACVDVDILRSMVNQKLTLSKEEMRTVMFGRYRGAGSEAFGKVENACKTMDGFCNMLSRCDFTVIDETHKITLKDFQLLDVFIHEKNKVYLLLTEAILNKDDLDKYLPENKRFKGPDDTDLETMRGQCFREPIVRSNFAYGSDANAAASISRHTPNPSGHYFTSLLNNSVWHIIRRKLN